METEEIIMWILSGMAIVALVMLFVAFIVASEYFKIHAGEPLSNFENFVVIALTIIVFNSFRK